MTADQVRNIVVHCSATKPSMDIGRAEIDLWHRQRGFFQIGYHLVIRRDGRVETGRPLTTPGAHATGFNRNSVAVCLVGGVDEGGKPADNFTEAQRDELLVQLRLLRVQFPHARILGHRDLPNVAKACPSFDVRAFAAANGINPEPSK